MGRTARKDFRGAQICSPVQGCSRRMRSSSEVRGPALRRMWSGMATLPMSWRKPARRRADFFLGQPLVLAQEHGILRQPLTVAARVRVFGFDAECQGKK